MNRVIFLVDGLNLYHSIKRANHDLKHNRAGMRWLDIHSLCNLYLAPIGNEAKTVDIYYFSALAYHLESSNPGITLRHQQYIDSLKSTGVRAVLSRFKRKTVKCEFCHKNNTRYEEKETDVAISAKLIEIFLLNQCDTAVIVSGDTDLAPAVRTVKNLYPAKTVCFIFPYRRKNKELAQLAHKSFYIRPETYLQHQLPDPFVLSDGTQISKPAGW